MVVRLSRKEKVTGSIPVAAFYSTFILKRRRGRGKRKEKKRKRRRGGGGGGKEEKEKKKKRGIRKERY